jgi:carbon-monoxide dehydrogenase medium subunit
MINLQNSHLIPFSYEYFSPESIEEALSLLREAGDEAVIFAGGTDLIPRMKQRSIEPRVLINLKKIRELKGIRPEKGAIVIGSLTRLRQLEKSEIVEGKTPLLHDAVKMIGSVQIRNMATIGGNLCNASPCADSAVALLALDAEVETVGFMGARRIPLCELFTGPGETVLKPGELLKEIIVPYQSVESIWDFVKVTRTELDLAVINMAYNLELTGDKVQKVAVAFGSVAPIPLRLRKIEDLLIGREIDPENILRLSEMVPSMIDPISDVRGSRDYRLQVSKNLVKDMLIKTRVGSASN